MSEWMLLACVLLASIPGIAALVGELMHGTAVASEIGTLAATATNAKDIATMSERNAKLAQYQLEEAAKAYHLEIPKDLPKETAK